MMGFLSHNVFLRFTDRGVISVNRASGGGHALDVTVTEYWPGECCGRTVTKRLWARSPWWPEFAEVLGLAAAGPESGQSLARDEPKSPIKP